MTTYTGWSVGDVINICASISEFCGTESDFIWVKDINVTKSPDVCTLNFGTGGSCSVHINNVGLTFSLVKGSDSANCTVAQTYKTIGSTTTSSNGTAGISYTVTEQDRLDYVTATNEGYFYRVMVCITNSDGQPTTSNRSEITAAITIAQNLCAGVTCPNQCIGTDLWQMKCDPATGNCVQDILLEASSLTCTATHNLDIYVDPHSWYTPGGAASAITNVLADVSGAIINGMTEAGLTNWTYLDTEVITEADRVIIRTYLKEITPSPPFTTYPSLLSAYPTLSSTCPGIRTLALGPWVIIGIALAVVIIGIGIVVGYSLYRAAMILLGETYTKEEVGQYTNDILTRMMDSCQENFPTDPVGYANCVKSGIQATTGAAQDFFDDPTIGQSGQTASDNIDVCITDYNNPSSPKYHDSVALKTCTDQQNQNVQDTVTNQTKSKGSPFGALLIIGAALIGMSIMTKPATAAAPVIVREYIKGSKER